MGDEKHKSIIDKDGIPRCSGKTCLRSNKDGDGPAYCNDKVCKPAVREMARKIEYLENIITSNYTEEEADDAE